MSTIENQKQPPLLGIFWLHEIPLLALIGWGFYNTNADFRGSPWTVFWFGVGVLAGVVMLALRCQDEWRVLPNKLFFFTLSAVWVAMFVFLGNSTFGYVNSNSIFFWAFDVYTSPIGDNQFGLYVPFAVLALLWWKRKQMIARPLTLWWPGIFLVAVALGLHLLGYVIQQPRLSLVAFLLGLYGLTGLAWGNHWLKASRFPFFLLVFCIPPAGIDWLTFKMRLMVSWTVAGIAHLGLAPDLIREGTQLFDAQHTFAYEVAAACSGIRSLTALLVLTTIYGFVVLKTPWKRAVVIASAFPLAILGNVIRLCFTIMVAELAGQDAGKMVETKFGFITFAVAIGCIFLLVRQLEKSESTTSSQP